MLVDFTLELLEVFVYIFSCNETEQEISSGVIGGK